MQLSSATKKAVKSYGKNFTESQSDTEIDPPGVRDKTDICELQNILKAIMRAML